jgi:hypothetical protein
VVGAAAGDRRRRFAARRHRHASTFVCKGGAPAPLHGPRGDAVGGTRATPRPSLGGRARHSSEVAVPATTRPGGLQEVHHGIDPSREDRRQRARAAFRGQGVQGRAASGLARRVRPAVPGAGGRGLGARAVARPPRPRGDRPLRRARHRGVRAGPRAARARAGVDRRPLRRHPHPGAVRGVDRVPQGADRGGRRASAALRASGAGDDPEPAGRRGGGTPSHRVGMPTGAASAASRRCTSTCASRWPTWRGRRS